MLSTLQKQQLENLYHRGCFSLEEIATRSNLSISKVKKYLYDYNNPQR